MGQLEAALAYLGAGVLWILLMFLYLPILEFLGVPAQPATLATGAGALLLVAIVLGRLVGVGPRERGS